MPAVFQDGRLKAFSGDFKMQYLTFLLLTLLSVVTVFSVSACFGAADLGKLYKPFDGIEPFKGKKLITLILVCAAVFFAVQISLYKNTEIINFVKLYGLLVTVVCAGVIDSRRRIIPNPLIVAGGIFRLALYLWEFLSDSDLKSILINDLIGVAIGFVFLLLVSLITKGALGFGDVKLFGVIGLTAGAFCTYTTLFISLVVSTVVSLVGIATKKMGRRDSFPFGPCIAVGYIAALLLTSY